MQTITFYAYKGGTGRSLALANAAKYLSRLGQSVLAIDLDLEAPGLHHKLRLGSKAAVAPPSLGVVDYLNYFIQKKDFPEKLAPYVVEVPKEVERDGPIRLMAAGNILSPDYWQRLAGINWHHFLFGKDQPGLRFFFEMKERIKAEFRPDFLLVDARTGITEVGGVATTILPDQVVCFVLNNQENLEGTRAVLRGLERASADRPTPIRVVPVVSRLPQIYARQTLQKGRRVMETETKYLDAIRDALCEPKSWDPEPLELPELHLLHSEESLAFHEGLRIGSNRGMDESPLLRDYLRLFAQIIPNETVASHLDRLVAGAIVDLMDKPERAQSELQELAEYCPHPTSYMALLKLYRLRSVPAELLLKTAVRYWEVSRDASPAILRQVVQDSLNVERLRGQEEAPLLSEFLEAVWTASPDHNPSLGLKIANYLIRSANAERGAKVVRGILNQTTVEPQVFVECVNLLTLAEEYDSAIAFIETEAPRLSEYPEFQSAWASAVVRKGDPAVAKGFFESKHFRPATLMNRSNFDYIRLLMLTSRAEELDAALARQLEIAVAKEDLDDIAHLAVLYDDLNQMDVFRARVTAMASKGRAERILSYATERTRMGMRGKSRMRISAG